MSNYYGPASRGGFGGRHGGGGRLWNNNDHQRGRGPRPPFGAPPGSSFPVLTNCFQALSISGTTSLHRYHAQIVPKKRIKEGDRIDGELPPPENMEDAHPEAIERMQRAVDKAGQKGRSISSTREALQALNLQLMRRDPAFVIATDGAAICYSPTKLFEREQETFVVVCGERVFKVILSEAGELPLSAMQTEPTNAAELGMINEIVQAIETILKDALGAHMLKCNENPNTFYFPEYLQMMMHERSKLAQLHQYFSRDRPFAPFVGLHNSVRLCDGGQIVVAMNNRVDFLTRQSRGDTSDRPTSKIPLPDRPTSKIPLLNPVTRSLAGIELRSFDSKIDDDRLKGSIESALKKLTFTVRYEKGRRWEEKRATYFKEKGKSDDEIKGYLSRCRIFKSTELKMFQKEQTKPRILWGCDEEKFEKDGTTHTVASYFLDIYDIKIQYPNMPIVSTLRGFFPVEFLFQELSRAPNANNEKFVGDILKYNDAFAGRERINHINSIKDEATALQESRDMLRPVDLLSKFSIELSNKPVSVQARRLPAPNLMFGDGPELGAGNGDWNLKGKKFKCCASLSTYGVVDLGRKNSMPATEFLNHLFRTMKDVHGFKFHNFCDDPRCVQDLTVYGEADGPAQLYDALAQAVQKAKQIFMAPSPTQLGLRTTVLDEDGDISETIVTRYPRDSGPLYGIKCDIDAPTHWVVNQGNGYGYEARIKFKSRTTREYIDPMQLQSVDEILEIGFCILKEGITVAETEVGPNPEPAYKLDPKWQIECPSILFIYLPEYRTDLYDCAKMLCDLEFEVQSQCIVQKKCAEQGHRIGQYCSSVAMKVNTKLFNRTNNAVAWELQGSLPWVPWAGEEPKETMMIGYSMSHGHLQGKNATVVAGSVCLAHPMQMAQTAIVHTCDQREDIIDEDTLTALVNILARHFWLHADAIPSRLLVFRDGGSDGSFDRISNHETVAIRKAFSDIMKCPCAGADPMCKCSPPKITFVVAQRDHNITVAPHNDRDANKKNVPSGTLVDSGVTGYNGTNERFDFLLTPQCGAKGTSKPMYYRVLVNENAKGLKKDALYQLVYSMSFQYGTATKATRKMPLLLYSDRLANRVMKYAGYENFLNKAMLRVDNETGNVERNDQHGQNCDGQLFTFHGNFDKRVKEGWKIPFRPHITG